MIACFRFGSDDCITCAMIGCILFMLAWMWYDKWCEKHPHKPAELTVREAEIVRMKHVRRYPFQKKERQRVLIYAEYPEPDGRRRAKLATAPLRQTLAEQAPELGVGAKVRIGYEKKHPGIFYFAEPAYQKPEISGEPYSVFSLAECIGITLAGTFCIGCFVLSILYG